MKRFFIWVLLLESFLLVQPALARDLPKCNEPEVVSTLERVMRTGMKRQMQQIANSNPFAGLLGITENMIDQAKFTFSSERVAAELGVTKVCAAHWSVEMIQERRSNIPLPDSSCCAQLPAIHYEHEAEYSLQWTEDDRIYVTLLSGLE